MYAVVRTGGKQYRIAEGDRLSVERITGDLADVGSQLTPLLLVDGEKVVSNPAELASVTIDAAIVGAERGSKISGFTYKRTTNQRRRYGHRQNYSVIEIRSIQNGPKKRAASTKTATAKTATEVAPEGEE